MTASAPLPDPSSASALVSLSPAAVRVLIGLALARGRQIPDAVRTFEQLATRLHVPPEWLAQIDEMAELVDQRVRFSLSPEQRRHLLDGHLQTPTGEPVAAPSPATPRSAVTPIPSPSPPASPPAFPGDIAKPEQNGRMSFSHTTTHDIEFEPPDSSDTAQEGILGKFDAELAPVRREGQWEGATVRRRPDALPGQDLEFSTPLSALPSPEPAVVAAVADGGGAGFVAPFTPVDLRLEIPPEARGADRVALPADIVTPIAGPFRVMGRYEGMGDDGLFAVLDESSEAKFSIRIPTPRLFRAECREAAIRRLMRLAKLPLPDVLVKVVGAGEFAIDYEGTHPGPTRLRLVPGGHFGLVEEPRGTWVTLHYWLDQMPTLQARVEFAQSVADALESLAFHGVPHGRFTPEVLRVTPAGLPKIGDWAWAGAVPIDHAEPDASAVERLGTPLWFLAPEVFLNVKTVTSHADQYSLAVLMFRLFTGKMPPEWDEPRTLMQSIHAIERGLITKPSMLDEALPDIFDRVVLRAAAADPDRRYPDFSQFRAELDEALDRLLNPDTGPITAVYLAAAKDSEPSGRFRPGSSRFPMAPAQQPPPIKLPPQYDRLADVKIRGTANIFYVRHRETGGTFALKLFCIPTLNGDIVRRQAEHEYQALQRCQGDYIATLQDYGRFGADDQYHYVALEWAGGWPTMPDTAATTTTTSSAAADPVVVGRPEFAFRAPLYELDETVVRSLRDLRMPVPELVAVWIATHALRALHHCHTLGVVHYDIKPANFLCFPDGMCKLADFGVANYQRAYAPIIRNQIYGSPAYVSPEQVRGDLTPDPRSDLFSLGVMLHELVTGQRPNPPRPPNEFGLCLPDFLPPQDPTPNAPWGLSPAFAALIGELLQPDPRDRIRSAADAFDRLKASPAHPVAWSQVKPFLKRSRRTGRM